jgi:RecA-family ATPase
MEAALAEDSDFVEECESDFGDSGLNDDMVERLLAAHHKEAPPFQLLTVQQLRELPPPRWLVQGLLKKQSLSVLYGPSGEGKSFVALDLAASISAGTDWQGRKVDQGPVVYVVAEGGRGIVRRIEAWRDANDTDTDSLFIVPEPVQMRDPRHRSALAGQIAEHNLKPALVVFDTFARCFVGGDENSAGDVGAFIAGVQELQREVGGAAVLIVHHTGKSDNEMERGSSALRAAADTMLLLRSGNELLTVSRNRQKKEHLTLSCNKQKDGDEGEPIHLRLEEVELEPDKEGDQARSCAVRSRGPIDGDGATSPDLTPIARTALEVLRAHPQGLPIADWITLVGETLNKTVSEHTFAKVRRKLVDLKLVESVPDAKSTYRASNPAK